MAPRPARRRNQAGRGMTADPLVSIITPFLNVERFIAESIESVLAQTYDAWELLLIDDGSTDGSTGIARDYAARYPDRIRYLEHPDHRNHGASASRNLGLAQANGRYLAMLDADDIWLPHKLEQQVALLAEYPQADLLYGYTEYWYSWTGTQEDRAKDYVRGFGVPTDRLYPPASLYTRFFLRADITTPCTCSLLIRRELIERVGGFEDQFHDMYDDQAFYAKLFLSGQAYVSSAIWDRYRQHPASTCHVAADQIGAIRLRFLEWLQLYFASQGVTGPLERQLRRALWASRHPGLSRMIGSPRLLAHKGRNRLRRLRHSLRNGVQPSSGRRTDDPVTHSS